MMETHLGVTIEEWYTGLRRHLFLILVVFAATGVAASIYVMNIPSVYRAETRILVNPQRVSDKYVSNAVSMGANERLNTLGQQVLSTSRLEAIFNEFNLFPKLRGHVGQQELIDRMRRNIGIELKQSTDGPSSFTLSYQGESAIEVAAVTNRLADSFIAWNLHDREQEAQGTTEFLSNELTETKTQLDQLEEQLRTYKLQHLGQLPDQLQANLQTLSRLQVELQANVEAQSRLDREMMIAKVAPEESVDPRRMQHLASPRERLTMQLSTAQQELTELTRHYTSQFPDVLRKQEEIKGLESQLAKVHEQTSATEASQPPESDVQAKVVALDRKSLAKEQRDIEAKMSMYQSRVDSEPIREQEISQLLRDYETTRQHYASLLEKNYSAKMAAELEHRQEGGSFTLLDVARVPDAPVGPNRIALLAGSLMFAIIAGLGAGALREYLDSTIKSEAMLRESLPGIPILGLVPSLDKAGLL